MFFSICIPTYNRSKTILRTLKSLEIQEFKNFEVIVVDDGSTDDTEYIINNYIENSNLNIKYFKKENGGKHTALNIGIEKAKGEFFLILDSDDWLIEDALNTIHRECMKIRQNDEYSGIMGKSMTEDKKVIGKLFPNNSFISSYVDFHFFSGKKYGPFGDCCECNKTKILKKYRFPEDKNTKFIPEAYVFDQIGVKYKLLCSNNIYICKEYMPEGISNTCDYKDKNIIGFLYHYISRLENVFPNVNGISLKLKIIAWWRYWDAVKKDYTKNGPRIEKVGFLGAIVYILTPIINFVFRISYRDIAMKGR